MVIEHFAQEAGGTRLSIKELILNWTNMGVGPALTRRFESVRNQLSEESQKVLDIIGMLDTAVVRVDLVEKVTLVSIEALEIMQEKCLIRFQSDLEHFIVQDLVRTWCRSRLDNLAMKEGDFRCLQERCAEFY